MILILPASKSLDFETAGPAVACTQAGFLEDPTRLGADPPAPCAS